MTKFLITLKSIKLNLSMNIYIAKLSLDTQSEDLRKLFELYGIVTSAKVITNGINRSKGFGFVEMENESDGFRAIKKLNNTEFQGNKIIVKKAAPPKEVSSIEISENENENKNLIQY